MRIGIATGRALLFEGDDYIGSAVNLAARLCDAAGPGEVLDPGRADPRPAAGCHGHAPRRHRRCAASRSPVTVANLSGTPVVQRRNDTGELWTRSPFVS